MGETILSRRRVSLGNAAHSFLTPLQWQQEAMARNALAQANDGITLSALLCGNAVSKIIQNFSYYRISPFFADTQVSRFIFKIGTHATSAFAEAGTFVWGEKAGRVLLQEAHPRILSWQGNEGVENAWKSAYVNFLALRSASVWSAGQNIFLRNFTNSLAMVSAHQATTGLGLTAASPESFTQQVLHASLLDFQMQASMQIFSRRHFGLDIEFHPDPFPRKLEFAFTPQHRSLASFHSEGGEIKLSKDSTESKNPANDLSWAWAKVRIALLFSTSSAKAKLAMEFASRLEDPSLSETEADLVLKVLHFTSSRLSDAQRNELVQKIQRSYGLSQEPLFRSRWIYALSLLMPRLRGPSQMQAIRIMLEAALHPYMGVADIAEKSLYSSLERIEKNELIEIGNTLMALRYPEEAASKRLRAIFSALSVALHEKSENLSIAQQIETARWFAQFIGHWDYRFANHAARNWLELLKSIPPDDAQDILQQHQKDVIPDFISQMHWMEASAKELRRSSLSALERSWYESREALAAQNINQALSQLPSPPEWQNFHSQAKKISSVQEALALQSEFQNRLRKPDANYQRALEQWWLSMSPAQRWMSFEFLLGPSKYLHMKGEEALRWRKLASMGLPYEIGLASEQNRITSETPVVLVLGSKTVGLPEAFIDEVGMEKAMNYLLIHHTHPHETGRDDINEIYPSTYSEGGGGGDLHILHSRFKTLAEGEDLAISLTQAKGGSILVLRKINGKALIDIFTANKTSSLLPIQVIRLRSVRNHIRAWAAKNDIEIHFFEVPYSKVEAMDYPTYSRRQRELEILEP